MVPDCTGRVDLQYGFNAKRVIEFDVVVFLHWKHLISVNAESISIGFPSQLVLL